MPLRRKTLLLLASTMICLTVILYYSSGMVLLNNYKKLEHDKITDEIAEAQLILSEAQNSLDSLVRDWSAWKDTFDFIQGANKDYIRANLRDDVFRLNQLNFIIYYDKEGKVYYQDSYNLNTGTHVPLPADLLLTLQPSSPLLSHESTTSSLSGILLLPEHPMLIASRPILPDFKGPISGSLIMGRFLDDAAMQRLWHKKKSMFTIRSIQDLDANILTLKDLKRNIQQPFVTARDRNIASGYAPLNDAYGRPNLYLELDMPRDLYNQGLSSLWKSLGELLAAEIIMIAIIALSLEKLVLWRLSHLSKVVSNIGIAGDLAGRVPVTGHDELSALAREINAMLEKLEAMKIIRAESEERLRGLAEHVPGIMYLCRNDEEYSMTYLNDKVQDITGYPKGEFLEGRINLMDLCDTDDALERKKIIQDALAQSKSFHFVYRLRNRFGDWIWLEEYGAAFGTDPNPTHLEGFISDVTVKKQAEEQRKRLEMRIQQAQKMESLAILAGGVAHDFNNLLMGVLGNVDLLLMDLEPATPLHNNALQISAAGKRAADLCKQMLAYSGKGHFVVQPLNLSELVEEMAHILEVVVKQHGQLLLNLEMNVLAIEADANQLRQVIMNLITNASDALEDRRGFVKISTGMKYIDSETLHHISPIQPLDQGDYVFVRVEDNGCGMNQETMHRIFDPFFTTKFTGRGLGLAAVQGIVKGHKAAITVDSEPGEGTLFTVYFPALQSRIAAKEIENRPAVKECGNGTIMVVDDEEFVRDIASKILDKAGFQVILAEDGQEAVDLFRLQPDHVDAILLDMTMPKMDGKEAYALLRQIRPQVPIIISSGYSQEETMRSFNRLESAGFLEKPYQAEDLIHKINEFVMQAQVKN